MVGNGFFHGDLGRPLFWEQSAALVTGPRFWASARARGLRVGLLFWQQSLGEQVDLLLTPKPIHKHHGGMIQDCYSLPDDLYERLKKRIGPFNLRHYWGPLASRKSTEWIERATIECMGDVGRSPDLLLTYLPHLDYDLQRHGPESFQAARALDTLYAVLGRLLEAAKARDYAVLITGDYGIEAANRVVRPNHVLLEEGGFRVRRVGGRTYPDFFASDAWAVVDHQIAHVHVPNPERIARVRERLVREPGVAHAWTKDEQARRGIAHPRSGDLVLVAAEGAWFAYPWWTDPADAPDYASHVDIHNKPGYDPCELFFGRTPFAVGTDPGRIRGTHGRGGPAQAVAWHATFASVKPPRSVVGLARMIESFDFAS